jgi:hypothetical protein
MHTSALVSGRLFFECYWQDGFERILDVGSQDINGSLRSVAPASATFTGVDMGPGNGVDLVLSDPWIYPFPDRHFDAVISTSCWEHDPMFWLTFLEGLRVLSPRGFLYVNAPSSGTYHGYPLDHWRFYPDAGIGLEIWGRRMLHQVRLVESFVTDQKIGEVAFNDCVMVFTKDPTFVPTRYLQDMRQEVYNARKGVVHPLEMNSKTLMKRQAWLT